MKQIEVKGVTVTSRPSILDQDKLKLWVRSGGRCAVCNKYLLDLTYGVSTGEMAHIVGWSKADKSPRGEADLDLSERNKVENLVLLCAEHHKIVDTQALLEEFTLERLIRNKFDHEQRIYHLTRMANDSETVVLRMFGGIRGAMVELSNEHARNIVFESERKYAMFANAFDRHGIEIDLSGLPEPEEQWEPYWSMAIGMIDKNLKVLFQGVQKGEVRHLSVFALTRIPLLVYLGYQLDDKIPTSLYQKHRGEKETWIWSESATVENFEVERLVGDESGQTTLIVSLSGTINPADLPEEVTKDHSVFVLRPIGTVPNRDILANKTSYDNFVKSYHLFLSTLEKENPNGKEVKLIPAVPVSAAIAMGRGVMRNVHPSIIIYDRAGTSYKRTLTIKEP